MKRLLVLFLVCVACTPTTQPNLPPLASDSSPHEWQESAEAEQRAEPTARFARPPAGGPREVEPEAWRNSRREQAHFDKAPAPQSSRGQAERAPRWSSSAPAEAAPQPAPPPAPSSDFSGVGKGAAKSEGWGPAPERRSVGGGAGAMVSDALRPSPKPEPRPEERPGLATSWGETRYSSVTEVPFERDGGRPSYTATLHYNDAQGAYALAGRGGAYGTQASVGLGGALTVSLRDEYGNTLSAYRGGGRTVAVGASGQRYTIVVQNNTNERFEVVLSVDGLDVLDGLDAGYGKRGYLIDPYAVVEIEGFRQSEDAVAAFRFGSVASSYAALTGSARNVGVIGAAAFGERGYAARLRAYQERMLALRNQGREIERRRVADPFPNGYAQPPLRLAR